jgi:hypothetical protein
MRPPPPAEEVFAQKRSLADGFCQFFMDIAGRVNRQSKILLRACRCYAKSLGYNPLAEEFFISEPTRANHIVVYCEIEGKQYICDPTWALMNGRHETRIQYEFLMPIQRTLCSHFPMDDAAGHSRSNVTFSGFLKQMYLFEDRDNVELRHETCPWDRFEVKKGFKRMIFSCSRKVTWISAKLEQVRPKGVYFEQSRVYGNAQVIDTAGDRQRFRLTLVFPEKGQYRCTLFCNGQSVARFHPFALKESLGLPYAPSMPDKYGAEVVEPKEVLTTSPRGTGIVKLKLLKQFAEFQPRIARVLRPTFQLAAPFRDASGLVKSSVVGGSSDKVELNITIGFTEPGLQAVSFAFKGDKGIFFEGLKLYFDVVSPQGQ